MSKKTKTALIVGAILIAAGLALCSISMAMGFRGQFAITADMKYVDLSELNEHLEKTPTEPFTGIDMEIMAGDVRLVPSDGYYIEYNVNTPVSFGVENGVLKIGTGPDEAGRGGVYLMYFNLGPSLFSNGISDGGHITVYYPEDADFGNVNIKNSFGDTAISGLRSNELRLTVSAGDIDLTNIEAAATYVQNDFGDVDVSGLAGSSAELLLSSGDITLNNVNIANDMSVKNSFGDIEAKAVSGTNITVESSCGDIEFNGFDIKSSLSIDSSLGDVDLKNPEGDAGQYHFDLSTDFGDIRLFDAGYSSKATVNSGAEKRVVVRNRNGDITVK